MVSITCLWFTALYVISGDTETLQTDFGPCGMGWNEFDSGWRGVKCDEHRGRVTALEVRGKAFSADWWGYRNTWCVSTDAVFDAWRAELRREANRD
jgi:hypothetical protein